LIRCRALSATALLEVMVARVIWRKEAAGAAPYIELVVCRNSANPNLIVAAWRQVEGMPWDGAVEIDRSAPAGFMQREVRRILEQADRQGVPFLLIEDPEELFGTLGVNVGQYR
jgi:hypothetical protein